MEIKKKLDNATSPPAGPAPAHAHATHIAGAKHHTDAIYNFIIGALTHVYWSSVTCTQTYLPYIEKCFQRLHKSLHRYLIEYHRLERSPAYVWGKSYDARMDDIDYWAREYSNYWALVNFGKGALHVTQPRVRMPSILLFSILFPIFSIYVFLFNVETPIGSI